MTGPRALGRGQHGRARQRLEQATTCSMQMMQRPQRRAQEVGDGRVHGRGGEIPRPPAGSDAERRRGSAWELHGGRSRAAAAAGLAPRRRAAAAGGSRRGRREGAPVGFPFILVAGRPRVEERGRRSGRRKVRAALGIGGLQAGRRTRAAPPTVLRRALEARGAAGAREMRERPWGSRGAERGVGTKVSGGVRERGGGDAGEVGDRSGKMAAAGPRARVTGGA